MSGVDRLRLTDSYKMSFGMPWVPVLPREQLAQMSDRQLWDYQQARKQAEQVTQDNPTGAGWTLPSWRTVMDNFQKYQIHVILGGVRSTKSTFASRACVWALGNLPECECRCYHVNSDRSKQDQQRFIWDALPKGLKTLPTKRSATHTIQFSAANGFTNDMLILPPLEGWSKGGRIDFSNYKSFENDSRTAEGFKAHLIWADEEMPAKLFETLTYRLTDYHGRMILSFTTLEGWSPLIQDILGKTKTLETRYSPLVKRKIPVLQESLSRPGALIHYFWTEDNVFIDVDEFRSKLRGRPEDEVLARAHGIPTKAIKTVFRTFDRNVHVVKHEHLPFIKNPNYPVTRYMVMDPGGSKNDFVGWVAIDAAGTYWCYREWPDYDTYGSWAEPSSTPEGKEGPAQQSLGYGINEMAELIRGLEGQEQIFERLVDPRMGAAERKGEEGATTIITDFDKADITLIPAPGLDIDHGIKLINGLLKFDAEKPRDSKNSPRIYFSEKCENWIHMMSEWTNYSRTEHTKEGPDILRYLVTSNPIHVAPGDALVQGATGSY